MNIYLEHHDEEIDQAINDAEQMQASAKATITKLINYLKRQKQQQIHRRFLEPSQEQQQQQSTIMVRILDAFNKIQKDFDRHLRDLKEMIPIQPNTIVIPDTPETTKQTDPPKPQNQYQKKLYPIFNKNQPDKPPLNTSLSLKECSIGRLTKFLYNSLSYPTTNIGKCELCDRNANEANLGPLLLIGSNKASKTHQIHEMCALWSQNLVFCKNDEQTDPENLEEEMEKAKNTICEICQKSGATLCCGLCAEYYHFLCLMDTDKGKLVPDEFRVLCEKHKKTLKKTNRSSNSIKQSIKKKTPKKNCAKTKKSGNKQTPLKKSQKKKQLPQVNTTNNNANQEAVNSKGGSGTEDKDKDGNNKENNCKIEQ